MTGRDVVILGTNLDTGTIHSIRIHNMSLWKQKGASLFKLTSLRQKLMLMVYRNWEMGKPGQGHVALNILNVNINKYEQRQCNGQQGRSSP